MLSIIAIYHKLCRMSMGKRTIEKLRILAEFIESRHGITLARAVSVNPAKMEKILSGGRSLHTRYASVSLTTSSSLWIS